MYFWFARGLSDEQRQALTRYVIVCENKGIDWRSSLSADWMRAGSELVDTSTYSLLHQINNTLGPRIFNEKVSFVVGDGASECINGDAYPCTVRKVTDKRVWVSRDNFKVLKSVAYSGDSTDVLASPQDVPPEEWSMYSLRKDGSFRSKGHGSFSLSFGRKYSQNPHI